MDVAFGKSHNQKSKSETTKPYQSNPTVPKQPTPVESLTHTDPNNSSQIFIRETLRTAYDFH
jgi:hypothetical protein